jgi:predicted methyltransferase
MKTLVAVVLGGLLFSFLVIGPVPTADAQEATADTQETTADTQTSVQIELLLGPGKTHSVTVASGQTAREILRLCKPAKVSADDDPWLGYPAAAGGSYVLLFAAEGTSDQMKGRLDPNRDKLCAVIRYPSESQENGKFLLPETLREKTCGELVTLKVPIAQDKARVVTMALGLSTEDIMQLLQPASDLAKSEDLVLLDAIDNGDRYLLVFSPPDHQSAHDPKTDTLSTVIYWQGGPSAASFLVPQQKRGVAVPAEYCAILKDPQQTAASQPQRPHDRPASVRAIAARLAVGDGDAVADIGAGLGGDTWVFAEIVGPSGTVYSEEITENQVQTLKAEAEKRNLTQVRPVQGRDDSPKLPAASTDLAYMRYVYHHVSKPREMLREIWQALKPGGHLVVIDRLLGTLRDWVPCEQRTEKHYWLAETTVVREAREEGFRFVACADELCESKDHPFVLIFQRPEDQTQPGHAADPFLPLAINDVAHMLLPPDKRLERPVIVALGQARELIPPILERSSGVGLEIVLEEWATQKDERPPLPAGVSLPATLTDLGDPQLGPEPIDAVFFLDTYHLLFHGNTLLAKLHERLTPDGCIYVLDRMAQEPLSRRDASHRQQIEPQTVIQELTAAGFTLHSTAPHPAADRFLLIFGKARSE